MRLFVVDHRARTHVAIRRVDESRLYQLGYGESNALRRLADAKDFACRLAEGRRVLLERPDGTFVPLRCVANRPSRTKSERWSPEDYERAYGPWAARRRRW